MHAALEVQDDARPEQPPRARSGEPRTRWRGWSGRACLWLAGLLIVISLSVADGLLSNTVAYERDTTVFYFPLMTSIIVSIVITIVLSLLRR